MPRMTGYEACRKIKADPNLKDIPVAFLSARGQENEIQRGYEAGAEAYWQKPFAPDPLVYDVKILLAIYGK